MSACDLGPMARQRQRHYADGGRRFRFSQASRWALKADETLKGKDATSCLDSSS
jgi:hypothetical protein